MMYAIYILSVWLHILAATAWVGGMAFLIFVVVPWLRSGGSSQAGVILRESGARFRTVGWICFGVLVVTGTFNLWFRGVRLGDFLRVEWLMSPFGKTVTLKLAVFVGVLVLSAVHDFSVGPKATKAMAEAPGSAQAASLRKQASTMGRVNALLALIIVALAVMIVRGVP